MNNLERIEGIGEVFKHKLEDAGINSPEQLLEDCSTPHARRIIAEKTGVSEAMLLKWVNSADLFRVKGIGEEYAELLERSGVDTVPELARRNAEHLFHKLEEVNAEKKLVRKIPSLHQVESWIAQAKDLPRMINY